MYLMPQMSSAKTQTDDSEHECIIPLTTLTQQSVQEIEDEALREIRQRVERNKKDARMLSELAGQDMWE